jgi:hypothetical protein
MNALLTPKESLRKNRTEICIKANNRKEKVKMGWFSNDSVPELNPKNLGNSPTFLSVTHTTLSAKQFRSYEILKIDFIAEFCSGQNSG